MPQPPSIPKPKTVVPRQVWVKPEDGDNVAEKVQKPLSDLRDQAAWVLLGEPGSGKSTSFQEEAEATGGVALHVDDFLDLGLDAEWSGKTLFLDGLDEVRARSGDGILHDLRRKLKEQGYPPFRIACRVADWSGATDEGALARVSPDKTLKVLTLDPLTFDEIRQILHENHGVKDAEAFVAAVRSHGLQELLGNPQTLEMLVKASLEGSIPQSHEETFRSACQMLAHELNLGHQQAHRHEPCPTDRILAAAGHLCAVMLLANKRGFALVEEGRSSRCPLLEAFAPPDPQAAGRALDTRLFRNEGANALAPSHRLVAEYLGARWLAGQIDRRQIPLRRVLNMLVGTDGRSVHGLRGLYAWLATLCLDAQTRMIQADPMTVLTYGDAKILGPSQKRTILAALRKEAEWNPAFTWDARSDPSFGALACNDLVPDFLAVLKSPERSEANEIHVRCVLDALDHGVELRGFGPALRDVVEDSTYWKATRKDALRVWWKLEGDHSLAMELLANIQDGRMEDEDDEFLGILLGFLYPSHLSPEALLGCIHIPKRRTLFGAYRWFVGHELPSKVPSIHLPIILDALSEKLGTARREIEDRPFYQLADTLVLRGLQEHGEAESGERLCRWLGIGNDLWGNPDRGSAVYQSIGAWLGDHPDHYIRVLAALIEQKRGAEEDGYLLFDRQERMHWATVPRKLGRWHLEQAVHEPNARIVRLHLREAAQTLWEGSGNEGLTLDDLFEWAKTQAEGQTMLEPLLSCEIQPWRQDRTRRQKEHEAEEHQQRAEGHRSLQLELESIREGSASTELLSQLAKVWRGWFTNTQGQTPQERFQGYCEPSDEILEASEAGFCECLKRQDIPTAEEIIAISFENQEYNLQHPCLVGMELLWTREPAAARQLPKVTLRSLVAFWKLSLEGEPPLWLQDLCSNDAQLVADVFVTYTRAYWHTRAEHTLGLHWLESCEPFLQPVAQIATTPLLETLPREATQQQVRNLESLLKTAFVIAPKILPGAIQERLKAVPAEMDSHQTALWLLAAAVIADGELSDLWECIDLHLDHLDSVADFVNWMINNERVARKPGAALVGGLVQRLVPHASTSDLLSGLVTPEGHRRDLVRWLVSALEKLEDPQTDPELERLLEVEELESFSFQLKHIRANRRALQREAGFRFLEAETVSQILANSEPANIQDLTQLTLEHLDDIAKELRTANDDGVRAFWNIEFKQPQSHREENYCRDHVMLRLRSRLLPLHVECAPEFDYANDKRADIRVSYRTDCALPIEIKKDSNDSLWTALRAQLIPQYSLDPLARGHGIYLVLWFGGKGLKKDPSGGQKPGSALDLQARLESQLLPDEVHRLFVRVIDVSWPG